MAAESCLLFNKKKQLKMKNVLVILFLFITYLSYSQQGWVYSVSKEGKETHKQCLGLTINESMVVFHVSGSTYEVFDKVGKSNSGKDLWQSRANGKIVTRQVLDDGRIVFWKTEKKAFYYKP